MQSTPAAGMTMEGSRASPAEKTQTAAQAKEPTPCSWHRLASMTLTSMELFESTALVAVDESQSVQPKLPRAAGKQL